MSVLRDEAVKLHRASQSILRGLNNHQSTQGELSQGEKEAFQKSCKEGFRVVQVLQDPAHRQPGDLTLLHLLEPYRKNLEARYPGRELTKYVDTVGIALHKAGNGELDAELSHVNEFFLDLATYLLPSIGGSILAPSLEAHG